MNWTPASLIDRIGVKNLTDALGLPHMSTVWRWRDNNRIPQERLKAVVAAAKAKQIRVKAEDLIP